MKSNNDHVFRKLSYDTRSDEWDKENDRSMSRYHSSEFKIDTKNRDSVDDPPGFHMFEDDITDCEFHEIVFSNYKELTYNVVKDICVDEGMPLMQEKFLFNETDSIKVISSYFESKSSEEVKDDSEVPPRDVVVTSTSVSKEALTLGGSISVEEDYQKPPNNNNINGNEENLVSETEQEKTEEPKGDNLSYISFEIGSEQEKQLRNDALKDSYDHKLFSNGFGERSFCEAESSLAHITYSGPISVSGSLSLISEGSARSFAFPILQSECNSSPERMVEADKRQLRKAKGWRHFSLLLCCRF